MGKLFLVATPIGNLKDITLRALDTLKNVDLIAAEDTRQSLKLLNHFNIKRPLMSYHKYNENDKSELLIQKLKDGKNIALVSDAGTPGISDPGNIIVRKCIEEGIDFEVLPGATAVTTALVYSGMDTSQFIFMGFLPRENKDKRTFLQSVKDRSETLIIYESPHRLINTLEILKDILDNRRIAICRELTKVYEQILRFTIEESIKYYSESSIKGEFVLVIEGRDKRELLKEQMEKWVDLSIEDHIRMYIEKGLNKKEAVKKVAKDRNICKSQIYKYSINL
ncbi:16S rRNA (cytidine(1402)-2'-O)-methyltransferase [Clostridium kluyveri]|uniref:Ribosomal RNA small subunit methyltransferase I n=1 Tax=Clostridium kluyveri TaxID=1534 RepID=A0A1L5FDP9_CLOKL|nr:16S rRNA (cytidine(1402)-2'-O)-methyltransferase [Clostridium kluyveri]APM41083.1 16S rRNA (cytidine(1402)-2'-O)-methyltransferase [Clostridium kluyveri]UZQ48636.1 16S rRNA (cytidine(1402)-2'-O)-methyltransferase [Clostridium kluyveri]